MIFVVGGFVVLLLAVAVALRAAAVSLAHLTRADVLQDAAEGHAGAGAVARFLEDRAGIHSSTSLVHSALLLVAAITAGWALSVTWEGGWLAVFLVWVGVVLVLVGEILPRFLGRNYPRRFAYRLPFLLRMAHAVGHRPVEFFVNDEQEDDSHPQEQDQDEANREEKRLISSVLEFSEAIVREVMVPRTDMVTLDSVLTMGEARRQVVESGFSRIPVTGEGIDDIIGLLYAKDLLRLVESRSPDTPVWELIRDAHFVPETKTVRELLREMQTSKVHIAIAVDEFGGTSGLVTIEDLIEELVGEIVDEYDQEAPMLQDLGEGTYLVDARLSVDDFNARSGGVFPDEEWDTVGGLVMGLAGRVPEEGEHFEYGDAVLTSERVRGRRVERVRVQFRRS